MTMNVLSADQQRRLATHLGLLAADLETLARSPELAMRDAPHLRVREPIAGTHPALSSRLDPRVAELRRLLEELADAAAQLPTEGAGDPA